MSLRGRNHTEGVYACILSTNGMLVNLHVFVLMRDFALQSKLNLGVINNF